MRRLIFTGLIFIALSTTAQQFDEKALIQNLKILSADSMAGRRVGSTGSAMARDFVKYQFKKLKLEPLGKDYELNFNLSHRGDAKTGINLAGVIRAKSKTDKYIVISAHYDHEGVKGEKIYNGADDNASGVSALFAIAEHFRKNKPSHNLLFVAFDAEEIGLQGARAFVKKPPVALDKIVLNVNMDMVARADKNALVACGTFYYPQLKPFLQKIEELDGVQLTFGHDDPQNFRGSNNWTQSSDHGPFHDAKIPFIYFGVEDHADYHKATDDFEKVNPATYVSCVKLIVKSVVELDKGLNAAAEF
jgi:Zn-dependent M28 family amino/carboxypeptidase